MRPGALWSVSLAVGLVVCVPLALASGAGEPAGGVRGRVSLAIEGATLADAGPIVAYLERLTGARALAGPDGVPRVRQRNARFAPGFLAIAVGQTVEMRNDDAIYHNVFSYSKPNEFDLGLYRAGESRSVTFDHPGPVRYYCSIHESMNGTLFVAPTPHFATVSPAGAFEIRNVPEGRYRLRTWCERLPEAGRELRVRSGELAEVEIEIGPSASNEEPPVPTPGSASRAELGGVPPAP